MKFQEFRKIPRFSRDIIITEKIDGTNGQIFIYNSNEELLFPFSDESNIPSKSFIKEFLIAEKDGLFMFAGSRNRWLQIGKNSDNMGFASWVKANSEELFKLGEGRHYGEYIGKGIQRGYGLDHKRFYLFNTNKWANKNEPLIEGQNYCPDCCKVVPILYIGNFDTNIINAKIEELKVLGSRAIPGYNLPEGIVIFHTASGQYFKKMVENDAKPKSL